MEITRRLFELVAGFGLGASFFAFFGRLGGGLFPNVYDIGSDLIGLDNPAEISSCIGCILKDILGFGSDLFGSLVETTCAVLVLSSTSI